MQKLTFEGETWRANAIRVIPTTKSIGANDFGVANLKRLQIMVALDVWNGANGTQCRMTMRECERERGRFVLDTLLLLLLQIANRRKSSLKLANGCVLVQ